MPSLEPVGGGGGGGGGALLHDAVALAEAVAVTWVVTAACTLRCEALAAASAWLRAVAKTTDRSKPVIVMLADAVACAVAVANPLAVLPFTEHVAVAVAVTGLVVVALAVAVKVNRFTTTIRFTTGPRGFPLASLPHSTLRTLPPTRQNLSPRLAVL